MLKKETGYKGWHYSENFNHLQKVNKEVYVYVRSLIYGLVAQLYMRGDTGLCKLEVRTEGQDKRSLDMLIDIGEEWLEKYSDGDLEKIEEDKFSISNPNGVWGNDCQKKLYWLK